MNEAALSVDLAGIRMKNPVMVASGTFGYGRECKEELLSSLGAVVVKATTLKPKDGNPPPRLWETPAGVLNSIGLQNPGVERFLREHLPWLSSKGVTVICNIAGETQEEYAELATRLDGAPGLSGLEINVSCPNVKRGGMAFCQDAKSLQGLVECVKARTRLPVLVKMTPLGDIAHMARVAVGAGADGLSLINTVPAMAIDIWARRPALGATTGGLSGPAIRPIAVRAVWLCRQAVGVPIVGIGGIASWEDALEFILAGATAVAVGSAMFRDPDAPLKVLDGLSRYVKKEGVGSIGELVGGAHGPLGCCPGCRAH